MTINGGVSRVVTVQSYGRKSAQEESVAIEKADYTSIIQKAADTPQSSSDAASFPNIQNVPTQKATAAYHSNTPHRSSLSIFEVIYRMQEHLNAYSNASSKLQSLLKAYDTNPQGLSKANEEVSIWTQALSDDAELLTKAAEDLRTNRSNTKNT